MFVFAILLIIFSYGIFSLGILGVLYREIVVAFTLLFLGGVIIWKKKQLFSCIVKIFGIRSRTQGIFEIKFGMAIVFLFLFVLQALVNLIGVLGPELAFDALWYHLTIPKIWLLNHSISFIPGGLLYYSAMPKLGETFFAVGLAFGNEISVKLIQFSFGLLCCFALYKLQRKFFSPVIACIGVVIFYSNLVVAWESITAYIDLIRTFFEIMALWAFLNWWENKKDKWLFISAIMIGAAITTKLLSIGSLVIFSLLLIIIYKDSRLFIKLFFYWLIALLIPLPWFIFSYLNTGNPVYPFFSDIYKISPEPLTFISFIADIWNIFIKSPDPLSPLYLIFLPLLLWYFSQLKKEVKIVALYSVLAIVLWYFTPRTGGGRFMLPYLPAFSMLCAGVLQLLHGNKKKNQVVLYRYLIGLIIFVSILSITYRGAANAKYLPVIVGQETKQEFLTNNLNFSFGDFYDIDDYFKDHLTQRDRILLYGFHNLYYIEFAFVDSSWVKDGDPFTYIATQNTVLPEKYSDWKLVYKNDKTMVKLYKK